MHGSRNAGRPWTAGSIDVDAAGLRQAASEGALAGRSSGGDADVEPWWMQASRFDCEDNCQAASAPQLPHSGEMWQQECAEMQAGQGGVRAFNTGHGGVGGRGGGPDIVAERERPCTPHVMPCGKVRNYDYKRFDFLGRPLLGRHLLGAADCTQCSHSCTGLLVTPQALLALPGSSPAPLPAPG
jgi:hypothetical protein